MLLQVEVQINIEIPTQPVTNRAMDEDTEVDTNTVTGPGTGTVLCCTEAARGKPFSVVPQKLGGSDSAVHPGRSGKPAGVAAGQRGGSL